MWNFGPSGPARNARGQRRGRGGRRNNSGRNFPRRRNNNNRGNRNGGFRGNMRGGRARSGGFETNARKNLVPPSSFTRSDYGRDTERLTFKKVFAKADLATLEEVQAAWSNTTLTTNNSVMSIYINVSNVALDNKTPASPVATTSKRSITRISSLSAQAHSTLTSMHLAGGKKEYNATQGYQRNRGVRQVESRPQVGIFHTRHLRLPNKAIMVNQKGYKLKTFVLSTLGGISVDYAHVCDILVCSGSGAPATGTIAALDISATVHTSPNPDYVDVPTTISPPDFMITSSKDPSLVLQGYNNGTEETTLKLAADKDIRIYSIGTNRFLARMNIDNVIPQPTAGQVYRLTNPVNINKDTNLTTTLSLAKYFVNPLDPDTSVGFFAYEGNSEIVSDYNKGSVVASRVRIPAGATFEPKTIVPLSASCLNHKGAPFEMGDRVLFDGGHHEDDPEHEEEDDDDNDSIISGLTRVDHGDRKYAIDAMNEHLRKLKIKL